MSVIIDTHIHLCPRWSGTWESTGFGRVRTRTGEEIQALPPAWEDSASKPERALAYMDWLGIERAVVLQGPLYGDQTDYTIAAVKRWPDRFAGFAWVDATQGRAAADKVERAVEAGLLGLKIEVPGQRGINPRFSFLGEQEMLVWARLNDLHRPLVLHLSNGPDGVREATEVRQLLDEFPRLDVVICHLGWPSNKPDSGWQERALLARHARVMLDLAALPVAFSGEGYPYRSGQEALRWAITQVGADKIMWGSDYPLVLKHCTYPQTLDFIRNAEGLLSAGEQAAIFGGNAARMLADWGSR